MSEHGSGYWSDVGNLGEYIRGNADALMGRVAVEMPGREIRPGVWIGEGTSDTRLRPYRTSRLMGSDCCRG